jgi:hypothetical protein
MIVDRIRWITRSALVVGALGATSLLAVPLMSSFLPDPPRHVYVETGEDIPKPAECPKLGRAFPAMVEIKNLRGTSDVVPFEIEAEDCGNTDRSGTRTLWLDRTKVLVFDSSRA